ncbi:hypothetical protein ACIRPX_20990 [Streptomyces sp. NPDC101225]|uniref:hypothetical protein n=1 Tax=Streptomyces sp. NPDC101225 TaxID=3366135 RepID=UPI0038265AA4
MGRDVRLFSLPRVYGAEVSSQRAHVSSAMEVRREADAASTAEAAQGMLIGIGVPKPTASRVADTVRVGCHYMRGHSTQARFWVLLGTDDVGVTVIVTDRDELPLGENPEWPPETEDPAAIDFGRLGVRTSAQGRLRVGCRIQWSWLQHGRANTVTRSSSPSGEGLRH